VQTAELMREVGLKCISFNGIPRVINCLGAFRASLPAEVVKDMSRIETRYDQLHLLNRDVLIVYR
jgi:hypothetical protein